MQISIRALVALAAVPLMAAACSVANPFAPASAGNQSADQMALKWAQCMRQHGVDVPDPVQKGQGGGMTVQRTADPNGGPDKTGGPDDPQFQAAMDACKQYQPKGGQGPGQIDQKTLDQLTRFAQCMRDHGIPMSDPKASGGGVSISASGGPGPDSDQFKQAQEACKQYQPAGPQTRSGAAGGGGSDTGRSTGGS